MKPLRLTAYAAICLLAASVSGCSDEEPTAEITLYDIVKLESYGEAGCTFTMTKPLSAELITLSTPQHIDTSLVHVGNRLLIAYVPSNGEAYTSTRVTLSGYSTILNYDLEDTCLFPERFPNWDADPVWLMSAWQSGNYLNVRVRLPYSEEPRQFALVRNLLETCSPDCPNLYLVHNLDNADFNTFDRAYYASFDISSLCEDAYIKGFNLILNNSNLKVDTIPFTLPR